MSLLQRFETLLCIFIASAISHDYTNTGPIQVHLTRDFREDRGILIFLCVYSKKGRDGMGNDVHIGQYRISIQTPNQL